MASSFVHLHVHSEYSILDSACKIARLLDRVEAFGMDTLALTDHGVMGGAIKFYRQAKKRGIKPILGCEIYVAPEDRRDRSAQNGHRFFHLVLLAENETGYRNLLRIVSKAHTEGFYYRPRADKQLLEENHEGLIALSACESGEIPRLLQTGQRERAVEVAKEYQRIFGESNFFIEIQHHGTPRDAKIRQQLIELARSMSIPLVATNDTHYLTEEDKLAHEVLLNIRANKTLDDPDHRRFDGDGYHFCSGEEMEERFAEVPEAIANTRKIADRCNVQLEFGHSMIPPFNLPEGESTADDYLRKLTLEGAAKRFGTLTDEITERLDYELSVIRRMEYSTYFLIVWDFIHYAHEHEISVGPGRGSAAGSLVAYCLGITSVDPLKYNLIFERFLNPDRISMPDFDIDFCVKGRDKVIDYVRRRYGGENWWERIAQIATYDRMAARSVVRDVGRVLGLPYSATDRVAKLVPFGWALKAATERVAELKDLYERDPEIHRLIDIAYRLEGLARNTSTHAAGVVIAPDALSNHVPLLRLSEGEYVTQFDMVDVEAVGLLKFDFLGLRNLTLMDETRESLHRTRGIDLCLEEIPLDDQETFELIRRGETAGIFQLESTGMTNLIRRVQPNRFEDLIALLALYRPGPLESGMTDEYVERRRGTKDVAYPHPSLREVLQDTFGLPIYQDQLMLMAQKLAGFTLAEADILRKAMGKKNKEIMASLREKFISGCLANDIGQELADSTFDDMEKFSSYGFNKSHTTAYAFVSYWTAYLKAKYPVHFMASLLTSVQGDTDKVAEYITTCRDMDIEVLPPDINESQSQFAPLEARQIRFGFGAIKHVGVNAVAAILDAREGGPFDSFFEMCRRIDIDGLDREALEALIKAGAFDRFGVSRRGLLQHLSEGIEMMQIRRRERQTGQVSIFGDLEEIVVDPVINETEFERADLLTFERELLGLYVTAHPLDEHRELLQLYCIPLSAAAKLESGERATIGGRVKKLRRIDTRRGDQMAFVCLEDGLAEVEITVFSRVLERVSDLLKEDALVVVSVAANPRNGEVNLIADEVFTLQELRNRGTVSLALNLDERQIDAEKLSAVHRILSSYPGAAAVRFTLANDIGTVVVQVDEKYFVTPCEVLCSSLAKLDGVLGVTIKNGSAP